MKKTKNVVALLFGILIIPNLTLISCTNTPQKACTLIGCIDGLKVELTGTLPSEYKVVVKDTDGNILGERECNTTNQCGNNIFFDDIAADSVTVEFSNNGNNKTQSFSGIEYKESQPNGPDCPPVCRQGSVTMSLND